MKIVGINTKYLIFNIGSLDQLIINENKESHKLVTPLQNGREAVSPLKFIFKSDTINLAKHNFKISW